MTPPPPRPRPQPGNDPCIRIGSAIDNPKLPGPPHFQRIEAAMGKEFVLVCSMTDEHRGKSPVLHITPVPLSLPLARKTLSQGTVYLDRRQRILPLTGEASEGASIFVQDRHEGICISCTLWYARCSIIYQFMKTTVLTEPVHVPKQEQQPANTRRRL